MHQKSSAGTLVLFILYLLLFLPYNGLGQWKKENGYDYEKLKATVACNEGDYKKSIKIYSKLIKKNYGHLSLYTGRADCYIKTGEYNKAIADYRYIIDHFPPDYKYDLKLAEIEHLKKNPKGELKILTDAIKRFDSPGLFLYRGNFYKNNNDYRKALEDYMSAFASFKRDPLTQKKYDFFDNLSDALTAIHRGDSALIIVDYAFKELKFDKSVYNPPFEGFYDLCADGLDLCKIKALIESNQFAEAIELSNYLINPQSTNYQNTKKYGYYYGAVARMHLGDYDGALQYFKRAEVFSKSYDGNYILYFEGECYYQLGKFGVASGKFKNLAYNPGMISTGKAYKALADFRNGTNKDIISTLDELLTDQDQYNETPEIMFIKARVLGIQEKGKEANEALTSSLSAGFSDRNKILFGLTDLRSVLLNSSDNMLTSIFNIGSEKKAVNNVARIGLLHCPAYSGKEKRLALVIGNGLYEHGGMLANPENDAADMAVVLEHLGFKVMLYQNTDQNTMKRAVDEFGYRLKLYDVGLFFYAGHGIQAKGINYLIPVDATITNESDVEFTCVDAGRVLSRMEDAHNRINIIVLDACRDNPFERSWGRSTRGRGLAKMDAPKGSIIAYATEPGNTASDGTGRNGLYTGALLEEMQSPGIIIEKVFRHVRTKVLKLSGEKQTPWESTSLTGDFYFLK